MEMSSSIKKAVLIVLGIVLLSALGAVVASQFRKSDTAQVEDKKLEVNKTEVPASQLPGNLPQDLPYEKDAKVIQNFSAVAEDGAKQYTRSYETKRSAAENIKVFTDYLTKNGWTITATIQNGEYNVVAARKEKMAFQMDINTDSETKALKVTISMTEFVK